MAVEVMGEPRFPNLKVVSLKGNLFNHGNISATSLGSPTGSGFEKWLAEKFRRSHSLGFLTSAITISMKRLCVELLQKRQFVFLESKMGIKQITIVE